ncbi:MAG: hypothetical protein JWO36_4818 [Myxococcales bacterium]|nr:hypothetical protein [Myxococcales bacterium]
MVLRGVVAMVVLVGAPRVVHARHGCYELTEENYERCSVPTAWFETGMTALRYTPDKIDTTSGMYHLTTAPGDQVLSAIGWRFRAQIQSDRGFHAGMELDYAQFGTATVNAQSVQHGTTMTMPVNTQGDIVQAKLLVGKHVMAGPVMFGGELASGLQLTTYTTTDVPNYVVPWVQSWFVMEAHATACVWLTSHVTVMVESSVDVAHYDRVQLGLLFGVHLVPFDGLR